MSRFSFTVLAVLALVAGCESSGDSVGPRGGTIVSEDGRFSLEIRPGALEQDVDIAIHEVGCGSMGVDAVGPTTGAADDGDADSGTTVLPWLAAGIAALALVVVLVLLLRRRSSGRGPVGSTGTHDTQDTNDTHDRTAATDGVAAMTKEHSNGTDR